MRYILLAVLTALTATSEAQWTPNVSVNTPVCVQQKSQKNTHIVTDGNNGAVICWEDSRTSTITSTDIYAQRMNSSGNAKWLMNGMAVCSNSFAQASPAITEAGNGEVIIVWEDLRNGNYDIFAQKLDSLGNPLWTSDGIAVCSKSTNQKGPKILSDGSGGAVIVWEDSLNFYWDIYAQRISSSGTTMWASGGVVVCAAQNTQNNPRLDFGMTGGAIITWQDKRNNSDYDIYAQSIDGNGVSQWAANGIAICNVINTQNNPRIEPDGSGGAIIAWEDKRNGIDYDIYCQTVNSAGVTQWAANGIAVVSTASNQSAVDMKYAGGNKICLSWKDFRTGNYAIYVQMLDLTGTIQLPANGVQLSSALKSINSNIIGDGTGGVIVAWQDSTVSGWNITSQKINSTGQLQWPGGGLSVSGAADNQINVSQVSDNSGGAIYTWDDHRNGTDYDIFAQKIYSNGTAVLALNESESQNGYSVTCFPNPINSNTLIRLNGSASENWQIAIYDIRGINIKQEQLKAGESMKVSPEVFKAGIYFYEVKEAGEPRTLKGKFISVE